MTPIDVMASEPHFADHVAAVYLALPEEDRGVAIARSPAAEARFTAHGIAWAHNPVAGPGGLLVAAVGDLRKAAVIGRRHLALMEHGAGQSYAGRRTLAHNPSYAGGTGRDAASLFLHPNQHAARRDRAAYPRAQVEVVGSPYLDTLPARGPGPGPVVAVAFHFDLGLVPETRSAFPWIREELRRQARIWTVLGHGHPRYLDAIAPWYTRHGMEVVRDFAEICARADVLVADNTSALFAFAATDRPVVVLNPPWYDRGIDHGLRFWQAATVGIQVNRPDELGPALEQALADPPEQRRARDAALELVYQYRAGGAERAADALLAWAP